MVLSKGGKEMRMTEDETESTDLPRGPEEAREQRLALEIQNEDDGDDYRFEVEEGERLDDVIVRLYEHKLRREPREGDRLRCAADGQDVFVLASMTFKEYLAAGHCPRLDWVFAGATGGA